MCGLQPKKKTNHALIPQHFQTLQWRNKLANIFKKNVCYKQIWKTQKIPNSDSAPAKWSDITWPIIPSHHKLAKEFVKKTLHHYSSFHRLTCLWTGHRRGGSARGGGCCGCRDGLSVQWYRWRCVCKPRIRSGSTKMYNLQIYYSISLIVKSNSKLMMKTWNTSITCRTGARSAELNFYWMRAL